MTTGTRHPVSRNGAAPMTTPHPSGGATPARLTQLATSHRATQATHRNALATEAAADVAAARRRLERINDAVRDAGHVDIADALDTEARTGAVLLTLLTADDDTSSAQLASALGDYQNYRAAVEALLADAHHDLARASSPPMLVETD